MYEAVSRFVHDLLAISFLMISPTIGQSKLCISVAAGENVLNHKTGRFD